MKIHGVHGISCDLGRANLKPAPKLQTSLQAHQKVHLGEHIVCDLLPSSVQVAVFMKISAGEIQAVAMMVLSIVASCSGKKTCGDRKVFPSNAES